MTGLLLKQLFRSKGSVIGLVLLFATGLLSIYVGKVFVDRQQEIVELTVEAQQAQLDRNLQYHGDGHIGLLLYYVKFGYADDLSPLAGLSIGQKDIRQAAQLINIRNLEEQKNAYELVNPFFQLLGNLDFSFLVIFLFPLVIIALSYNLWSEEQESGRWPLLSVQNGRPMGLVRAALLLRAGVVLSLFAVLLAIAAAVLYVPLGTPLLIYAGISLFYLCFWFSLSWFVITRKWLSATNAILLLTAWILLTTILPALANSAVTNLYPIPEAYATTIDSREGYHEKWDLAKEPTIQKFKEIYPQYAAYEHLEDASFGWLWYYAMQHMGDVESREAREAMMEKLYARDALTRWIGYFVPSIHAQVSLNAAAGTDLANSLRYMEALEAYHEELRLSLYPAIFEAAPVGGQDLGAYGLERFGGEQSPSGWVLLPLLVFNLLFLGLGGWVDRG